VQQRALGHRKNKMAEENKQNLEKEEKKSTEETEKKVIGEVEKKVEKKEEKEVDEKKEEKSTEETEKKEEKEDEKKEKKVEKKIGKKEVKAFAKKYEAVARGDSLPISKKHGMYICKFIKYKPIDSAISDLNMVINFKKAVPFKGEIPHRKGMMSGRYPIKASNYFVNLLKGLKGNSIVNGLDLEKVKIHIASSSWASRPTRAGGRVAKRTNVLLKAKEFTGGKV